MTVSIKLCSKQCRGRVFFQPFWPLACEEQEVAAAAAGDAALTRPALLARARSIGKALSCTEQESASTSRTAPTQTATGLFQ